MPSSRNRRVALFALSILAPAIVLAFLGFQLYSLQQSALIANARAAGILDPEELARKARAGKTQFAFYAAGVAFAFSVTLFCRYVVWQDVKRETQRAEVRARTVTAVAHELRTPLTSIRMYAETLALERIAEPDRRREYLETIAAETRRVERFVDHMLRYARSEAGPGAYQIRPASLRTVVEKTLRNFEPRRGEFDIRLDAASDPAVAADPVALEHALENLLTNAMKYSGGAREIRVGVGEAGGRAFVCVADQGIGVPPALRARIFEEFFRADPNVEGVGLGLTLVRRIAEAHGGRVTVADNAPRGTVFTIWLPKGNAA